MYRNTYLEMYKNAYNTNASLPFIIAHFTQIYNALGCVLQDIEFQVGKVIAHQPPTDQLPHYHRHKEKPTNNLPPLSQKEGSQKFSKPNRDSGRQMPETKAANGQLTKKQADLSEQSQVNWMSKLMSGKPTKPQQNAEMSFVGKPVVEVARNAKASSAASGSFDDLFNIKQTRMDLQHQPARDKQMAIPQLPQEIAEVAMENTNTFDDFFDHLFKEGSSSRKSR